jgi:glycosyltransferase involved in cell wall biosynthesis
MKILMLSFNVTGRGTWYRAFEFARHLVGFGHSVTLVATSPVNRLGFTRGETDGIRIIETPDLFGGPLRSGWDPLNTLSRMNLIRDCDVDIVHAFESRPVVILPALQLQRRGIPLVMDWADWFGGGGSVEERPNPILRALLRPVETFFEEHYRTRANATTVICQALKERALKLGVDPGSIEVIPNGFDIPGWKTYTRQKARKLLGFPEYEHLVGYVGSLFPRDARLMAESFNELIRALPGCRLIHTGTSRYSSRPWLSQPDRLIETGNVSLEDLCLYLAACDVCWLPLRASNANRGRFPMKLSNYLAAGRAVVATNVGDVPYYIQEGKAGEIVPDISFELAGATRKILSDQTLRNQFEVNSIKLCQDSRYSWNYRVKQLEGIYKSICSRQGIDDG